MFKCFFKDSLSIKNKLIIVTSITISFSLFLVLSFFIFLSLVNEQSKLHERLTIQTEIIANNVVPAVLFDDPLSAKEILTALKVDSTINSAKISINNDTAFANYNNPHQDEEGEQLKKAFFKLPHWVKKEIIIENNILNKTYKIGKVTITACLFNTYLSLLQNISIAILISVITLILTLLLSNALLKRVVSPVIELTKVTRKVANLKDYTIRADIRSKDEVGELTSSFNDMLDKIQSKDLVLEKTVAERTSELIQLNKQLQHQAGHDPLTGLANRMLFNDRLEIGLINAQRSNSKLAVIYFDLDHFKTINDTLGHDTGDELLIAVAQRISNILRTNDTLCRLGGDEFSIILHDISSVSNVESVTRKMIIAFAEPFLCNQHELSISGSIGISLYPQHTQLKDQLKQFADIAMYHAKQAGRNNYCFFIDQMHKENNQTMDNRVLLKKQLKTAIENDELQIYYQPQVNAERRIIAVEALLRWKTTENTLIAPEIFIPLAAESGVIQRIEEWAFSEICQHYSKWKYSGLSDIKVAINIFGYRLRQQDFNHFIDNTLKSMGLSASFLVFEIKESDLMLNKNITEMKVLLNQLHEKGIKIAIDNFGTSYTSLNYLQQLPVDSFKIDSEFIHKIGLPYRDDCVIKAITGLADSLNKSVVAMGIETEAQVSYLNSLNCYAMQGYLFAKPMTEQQLSNMLIDNQYLLPKQ